MLAGNSQRSSPGDVEAEGTALFCTEALAVSCMITAESTTAIEEGEQAGAVVHGLVKRHGGAKGGDSFGGEGHGVRSRGGMITGKVIDGGRLGNLPASLP